MAKPVTSVRVQYCLPLFQDKTVTEYNFNKLQENTSCICAIWNRIMFFLFSCLGCCLKGAGDRQSFKEEKETLAALNRLKEKMVTELSKPVVEEYFSVMRKRADQILKLAHKTLILTGAEIKEAMDSDFNALTQSSPYDKMRCLQLLGNASAPPKTTPPPTKENPHPQPTHEASPSYVIDPFMTYEIAKPNLLEACNEQTLADFVYTLKQKGSGPDFYYKELEELSYEMPLKQLLGLKIELAKRLFSKAEVSLEKLTKTERYLIRASRRDAFTPENLQKYGGFAFLRAFYNEVCDTFHTVCSATGEDLTPFAESQVLEALEYADAWHRPAFSTFYWANEKTRDQTWEIVGAANKLGANGTGKRAWIKPFLARVKAGK